MTDIGTQLPAAAVISFLIQWMKTSKNPLLGWISEQTPAVNRIMAIAMSGFATLGLHFAWNPADHSLLITNLSLMAVATAGWHWFVQFAYTHGWFKATSSSDQVYQLVKQIATYIASKPEPALTPAPGGTGATPAQ